MGIGGISFGNAAHRPQTDAPPPDSTAGRRLTVALLLIMQRTRCTADAELMPPEGVRWALTALPPACSTLTADGCTAAEFDRRQAANRCPAADNAAHQMNRKPPH